MWGPQLKTDGLRDYVTFFLLPFFFLSCQFCSLFFLSLFLSFTAERTVQLWTSHVSNCNSTLRNLAIEFKKYVRIFHCFISLMSLSKDDPLTGCMNKQSVSETTGRLWQKPDSEGHHCVNGTTFGLFPATWTQQTLQLCAHLNLLLTDSGQRKQS